MKESFEKTKETETEKGKEISLEEKELKAKQFLEDLREYEKSPEYKELEESDNLTYSLVSKSINLSADLVFNPEYQSYKDEKEREKDINGLYSNLNGLKEWLEKKQGNEFIIFLKKKEAKRKN